MPAVDLAAIKDGIRERYRRKTAARAPNDETRAVALVMIDIVLEMMAELLEEHDSRVQEQSYAHRPMH